MLILEALAQVYDKKGAQYIISNDQICRETGLEENVSIDSLHLLIDIHCVEASGNACFKITYRGLDFVKDYRKRRELSDEFERVSEMMPQPRGRALQKLLAKIIEQHGRSQDEGIRTTHEEMDVIVYKDREYYLLESKWEKNPIEADVVRELYWKLGNRG